MSFFEIVPEEYIDDEISVHCSGNRGAWDFSSMNSELLSTFGIDYKFEEDLELDEIKGKILDGVHAVTKFKKENHLPISI